MTDKKQILVVDDSPNEIKILMELLKEHYAVIAAKSGEKAIEMLKQGKTPDLVLLDVMMETLDGYETCQKLHEIMPNLPVIFVSANTQTEEILQGFDAGGIDYITKPVDEQVLLSKVGVTLATIEREKNLKEQSERASEFITNTIASQGKLSVTINFLRSGLKLKSHAELVEELIISLKGFGLQGSVAIDLKTPVYGHSVSEISPLEKELLSRAKNMKDRFLEKGARLIINFNDVSILIKNLPIDDEMACGELKDHLMIIAEDAYNLAKKLSNDAIVHDKQLDIVSKAIEDSHVALREFEQYQKGFKERSIKLMDELMHQMETRYFDMGLTDEQEHQISSIIAQKVQEVLDHVEDGLTIDEQLKTIADSLEEIAKLV